MGFVRSCSLICFYAILFVVFTSPAKVSAGDIVHDDDSVPKKPGCNNVFILVIVSNLALSFFLFVPISFLFS